MPSDKIGYFLQYLKEKNIHQLIPEPATDYRGTQYVIDVDKRFSDLFPPQNYKLMNLSDPPGGSEYTNLYNRINSELGFESRIVLITRYNENSEHLSIAIEMDDIIKGGKKKSTKKRTPTKKRRRHTKKRKPTKRRRSTKRRR